MRGESEGKGKREGEGDMSVRKGGERELEGAS